MAGRHLAFIARPDANRSAGPGRRSSLGTYLLDHWLGRQSLAQSFWINLVLLRAVLVLAGELTHPPIIADQSIAAVTAVIHIVVAHGVIFAWQIVGVVRAFERYQAELGSPVLAYAGYFGIVVALIFTLAGIFTALQRSFVAPEQESPISVWQRERAAKYDLAVSSDGQTVRLTGSFERGVTQNLRTVLDAHPRVTAILLKSQGGNLYEGRGVASLIRDRSLDSYVDADCFSACATAFIAGKTRYLGPDGRLGFHQYRLDATYQVPLVNIAEEQARDRAFYRTRGIREAFLDRVFDAEASTMWVPDAATLVEAGVVHHLIEKR